MNSVHLIGRLTRDPEVRYSQDQMAIARFSVAIDRPPRRDGTKETDFPNVVVFGRQAETCEKYLSKGRMVAIEGRLQTGSYVNRNGDKVYTTEVVANRVEFLDWGDRAGGSARQGGYDRDDRGSYAPQGDPGYDRAPSYDRGASPAESGGSIPQGFEAINDDDIPF